MNKLIVLLFISLQFHLIKAQNVGIGTTSPSANLHVNGSFKMTDGSEGNNKVLTSNISGVGTWQSITALNGVNEDPNGFGSWGDCLNPGVTDFQTSFQKKYQDQFALGLEINDDFAFIGKPGFDTLGLTNCGGVEVYEYNGTDWIYKQTLIDTDGSIGNLFGSSIYASENWLIVFSPNEKVGGFINAGSVCIFELVWGTWEFRQKITESSPAANHFFGSTFSIYNNNIAIGCPRFGSYGIVYIYEYTSGTWSLSQVINNPTPNPDDRFGESVSLDGEFLVIGEPYHDQDSINVGYVHIYNKSGSTYNFHSGILGGPVPYSNLIFGWRVSLKGRVLIINSTGKTFYYPIGSSVFTENSQGALHLYRLNTGVFEITTMYRPNNIPNEQFYCSNLDQIEDYFVCASYSRYDDLNLTGIAEVYKNNPSKIPIPLMTVKNPLAKGEKTYSGYPNMRINNKKQFVFAVSNNHNPYVMFGKLKY